VTAQTQIAILTGANNRGDREPNDWYRTPVEATRALIIAEGARFKGRRIWEPSCGDGAMAVPLIQEGYRVLATDLIDRGYGTGGVDFMTNDLTERARLDAIVTNPPYKIAAPYIERALSLPGVTYVAMLLRCNFWHASSRRDLFAAWPPAVVYALTWRLDFTDKGSPTGDSVWVVWDWSRVRPGSGETIYALMPKPQETAHGTNT